MANKQGVVNELNLLDSFKSEVSEQFNHFLTTCLVNMQNRDFNPMKKQIQQ
jgi:hypothetical protein